MNPDAYQINEGGYGQPIYAVNEPGPGVVWGESVSERGIQGYLVGQPGLGAQPVYFVDGPPPGSPEWHHRQITEEAMRHAAAADGARAVAARQVALDEAHLLRF